MNLNKQHKLAVHGTRTIRRTLRASLLTLLFSAAALAAPVYAQAASGTKPGNPDERNTPALVRELRHQIQVLPFYSVFDHINFTLEGARVTLTGQVLRPTLKVHAEAAVKSLEGVAVVVDRIELLPPSGSDDELRNAVYRAIYEDPGLAGYAVQPLPSIHIIVRNGSVALEGTVESAADKHQAGVRASGVANVGSVKNNLVVQSKGSAGE